MIFGGGGREPGARSVISVSGFYPGGVPASRRTGYNRVNRIAWDQVAGAGMGHVGWFTVIIVAWH